MTRHMAAAAAAALLLAPAAGVAQVPAATPTPAAAKEKKICQRTVATGSVMPRMTCHTRAEWEAISQQSHDSMDWKRRDTAVRSALMQTR